MPAIPKTDEFLEAIHSWTRPLIEHEAFRQLSRSKIRSAWEWIDDMPRSKGHPQEVVFSPELEPKYNVVMEFYYLWGALQRLLQAQHYFSVYPFRRGHVSKHEHLENICQMYFFGFYVFEERLRCYLNALNAVVDRKLDVGKALKQYRKIFRDELQERHKSTHFGPFDDTTISAVMLQTLLRKEGKGRFDGAAYAHRKAAREWAKIAQRRSRVVADFLEAVSAASLNVATFLRSPPVLGPNDLSVK